MRKVTYNIEVKQLDEHERVVRGIATTPSLDRDGDIIEPLGARFPASVPFLVAHNRDQVVGRASFKKPTAAGIEFEARLPKIAEPGPLQDRVDTAWLELLHGLVTSVSIGFLPKRDKIERLPSGGSRYLEYDLAELSMVTVPSQGDAIITEVRAAPESGRVVKLDSKAAPTRATADLLRIARNLSPFADDWSGRLTAEEKASVRNMRAALMESEARRLDRDARLKRLGLPVSRRCSINAEAVA